MNKIVATFLVLLVLAGGGYLLLKGPEAAAPVVSENDEIENSMLAGNTEDNSPAENKKIVVEDKKEESKIVTYTDAGYSPAELKIKVGETVTFKNDSSLSMWTASALHPTHTTYAGTSLSSHCPDENNDSFDSCKGYLPGTEWSFKFEKTGTWGYHDHLHASHFGKIVVE